LAGEHSETAEETLIDEKDIPTESAAAKEDPWVSGPHEFQGGSRRDCPSAA
jgi:hypothetical protein